MASVLLLLAVFLNLRSTGRASISTSRRVRNFPGEPSAAEREPRDGE